MSEQKGFITRFGEMLDRYHAERRSVASRPAPLRRQGWLHWLGRQMIPNIGTLLLVAVLLVTVPSLAAPRYAPEATSTSTISYQGRLGNSVGNPLTGYYNLEFRIYTVPDGGVPLWEEFWTGGNSVQVSDGLFNVMLGSINNTLATAIEGQDELYLGITVGTDSEMAPRVQLGSVPFAMFAAQANVPDGSITTEKIADGAVTQAKAPFALAGPGYRMETGTAMLTGDEEGFGSNFLTKHITFSEPFSAACPTVVFANTSMGWVGWEARIVAMAGNISNSGFSAAVFQVDGGIISTHPHFEWTAVGCQ